MLADVLEQRRQHGQQGHRGVVDDLRDALGLAPGVGELALPEVLQGLLQVLRGAVQKRSERASDALQARLHDRPAPETGRGVGDSHRAHGAREPQMTQALRHGPLSPQRSLTNILKRLPTTFFQHT